MNSEQNPNPFTFVVLADIHFGQLADSPEFRLDGNQPSDGSNKRLSRRDALVATIQRLSEKPTALFVPGDLTSIASPGEFKGCVELAIAIADDVGISQENVFFTFGNHDTNWRVCELGTHHHATSSHTYSRFGI